MVYGCGVLASYCAVNGLGAFLWRAVLPHGGRTAVEARSGLACMVAAVGING
jgi:hypothetical protein